MKFKTNKEYILNELYKTQEELQLANKKIEELQELQEQLKKGDTNEENMKKYKIANIGCDDSNWFDIELNEEELKLVIRLFEENNKIASYGCTPHLYIYEYDENKRECSWEYTEDSCLNRDYEELNKED